MNDKTKPEEETPELSAFERMKEFTRRLIAVPKSELPRPKRKRRKQN